MMKFDFKMYLIKRCIMLHKYHIEYFPDKGKSLMAHIRRTRHIMMPACRSCFHFSYFQSLNSTNPTNRVNLSIKR
ncbi:leader peptide SpeFL [Mannheimia sp. E30BD]|uniref:leader peptide SpeFL n=1 Tax=Mannheimia sp. E30BD TaxID=3278708 RepID=UPI00359CC2FA